MGRIHAVANPADMVELKPRLNLTESTAICDPMRLLQAPVRTEVPVAKGIPSTDPDMAARSRLHHDLRLEPSAFGDPRIPAPKPAPGRGVALHHPALRSTELGPRFWRQCALAMAAAGTAFRTWLPLVDTCRHCVSPLASPGEAFPRYLLAL